MTEHQNDEVEESVPPSEEKAIAPVAHRRNGPFSPMARRLALLIALVALVVLGLFAAATLGLTNNDIARLSRQQRIDIGHAVASAAKASYEQTGGWNTGNLAPALTLASRAGLAVEIRDQSGSVVASTVPKGIRLESLGSPLVVPVFDHGKQVGSVSIRASTAGIGAATGSLRRALVTGIGWSALALAVLAVIAGIIFARRISRPVVNMTHAARSMASGHRGTRAEEIEKPAELAELSRAFNNMADNLEREDQLRRALVADVAHELRTPLAIVQATTEAMADGISPPTDATLSSLHDETVRLGRIVSDLEVLASAEAATLAMELEPVDLALVADEAATALRSQFDCAGVSLHRNLESAMVKGDRNRLHQVVTNLLTNAIKFTPAGGSVQLTVSAQGRLAQIEVEDTGRGIPEEDIGHIFDRFWRGPGVRQTTGSGVGLAVVRELVHAHGGEVSVGSQEGRGSRFVVTMPSA